MLEILVVMTILAIGLAARRRRGRRALVPVKFTTELGLGTLAIDTVITVASGALEHDFDVISCDLTVTMRGHTSGEGPIEFGSAMQDYTAGEIQEALDATPLGPYGPEMERSRRKVRHYATFDGGGVTGEVNDGEPIRRRMFLRVPAGKSAIDIWARQTGVSAGLTTGTVLEIKGVLWGRWK